MSLVDVRPGARARIREIRGGREMTGHLCSMGIYPGADVELVSGRRGGPVIVRLQGSSVAIGCGMAGRILVDLLAE